RAGAGPDRGRRRPLPLPAEAANPADRRARPAGDRGPVSGPYPPWACRGSGAARRSRALALSTAGPAAAGPGRGAALGTAPGSSPARGRTATCGAAHLDALGRAGDLGSRRAAALPRGADAVSLALADRVAVQVVEERRQSADYLAHRRSLAGHLYRLCQAARLSGAALAAGRDLLGLSRQESGAGGPDHPQPCPAAAGRLGGRGGRDSARDHAADGPHRHRVPHRAPPAPATGLSPPAAPHRECLKLTAMGRTPCAPTALSPVASHLSPARSARWRSMW